MINRPWIRWALLVVFAVVLFFLGRGSAGDFGVDDFYGEESMSMPMAFDMASVEFAASESKIVRGDYGEADTKIIREGSLSLVVKDVEESVVALTALATEYDGFVQSSNVWRDWQGELNGSVSLQVDAEDFEVVMEEAKALATVVEAQSSSSRDVTEEFIDLGARLSTLKAEESQYLKVLEQAKSVEEILQVHDYLGNVRGEIESVEGRLRYLEGKTDFSTITVSMTQEPALGALKSTAWQPFVVVKQAINALIQSTQNLVNGVIWGVVFGLPLVALFFVGRFFWKRFRS